ncbi:unnamed protein product, partial [Hapterophycus canaliculatus]
MDIRRTDREASLASVAGELEMEEQGDGAKLLKSKVNSMNLEVVTRMAPMELTISPQLLSPLSNFLHSSKVSTPGLILPARSPALDNLRVLAAGCRACSTKGHVSDVLRARGTKDVDVRAAGFTVRFKLEPQSVTATAARPPSPGGSISDEGMGGIYAEEGVAFGGAEGQSEKAAGSNTVKMPVPPGSAKCTAEASSNDELRGSPTCLELAVGCCIYQKGKYLLGHAEGEKSTMPQSRPPPGLSLRTPSPPPPPPPLPSVRENTTATGVDRRVADERGRKLVNPPEERTRGDLSPGTQRSTAEGTESTTQPTSSAFPSVEGSHPQKPQEVGTAHWGGGPGPRPCEEALVIVQSLRVPLSDPHYFRVSDLSVYLGMPRTEEGNDHGEGLVQRTQVLGGRDSADDGWMGELLITRCAVVGNPRQPGTRADAMLSRIRVEVSKEAVAAVTRLTLSLKRAIASPPPSPSYSRTRNLSWEVEELVSPPRILSPPWEADPENRARRWGAGQATSPRSVTSSSYRSAMLTAGVTNNWSSSIPLPRLALLSGLTTLRLNVSLAGVQAKVLSRGLLDSDSGDGEGDIVDTGPPPEESATIRRVRLRAERAHRCIRRVAKQLVERIHPAATSAGYHQACRLFCDEMGALGYDQSALDDVVQTLLETAAKIRDLPGHDEGDEDRKENPQFPSAMPPPSASAPQQPETPAMRGKPGGGVAEMSGERADVRELVEAGIAALPTLSVSDFGDAGGDDDSGGVGHEQLVLDIASVEASGLTLALTRLTYDTRFITTAEAITVRDADGIRILSAGRVDLSDGNNSKGATTGMSNAVGIDGAGVVLGASKKSSATPKISASRLKRQQARKLQEIDTTSAKEKVEAAAANLAENQKRETSALLISFMACDKRHIFGCGGDSPNVIAAVGR